VDFLVQMVIFVAAADVTREGVFQGGERTIVHEGCAMVEGAEGGRFEAGHVCIFFGFGETDFRLPDGTPIEQALGSVAEAIDRARPNREKMVDVLASGANAGGIRFETSGALR
jgi:hypothetical protein